MRFDLKNLNPRKPFENDDDLIRGMIEARGRTTILVIIAIVLAAALISPFLLLPVFAVIGVLAWKAKS